VLFEGLPRGARRKKKDKKKEEVEFYIMDCQNNCHTIIDTIAFSHTAYSLFSAI